MYIVLDIRTKIRNYCHNLNFNLFILSLKVGILPSKKREYEEDK